MPHVSARLAVGTERLFGHPVRIQRTRQLSEGIRVVTLTGDIFASAKARPGAEVEFLVSPTELRHYTLAEVDPAAQSATLILHTRGDGPGRAWARTLTVGHALQILGPARPPVAKPAGLLLGDTTALGLAVAFTSYSSTPTAGAVEVHPGDVRAASALLPGLDILPAAVPGAVLAQWLRGRPDPLVPSGLAHLAGHTQTCLALRSALRGRGMTRRGIRIHAYWADGKTGL